MKEYKVEYLFRTNKAEFEGLLNRFASDGWQLISHSARADGYHYLIFEREKKTDTAQWGGVRWTHVQNFSVQQQ